MNQFFVVFDFFLAAFVCCCTLHCGGVSVCEQKFRRHEIENESERTKERESEQAKGVRAHSIINHYRVIVVKQPPNLMYITNGLPVLILVFHLKFIQGMYLSYVFT